MRIHRNTIWLVPLLAFVTFPLWSIPAGNFLAPRGGFDPEQKNRETSSRKFSLESVKILQNQAGRKTAIIRADRAHTGKTLNVYIMENVDTDIFDNDNNITNIVAKKGRFDAISEVLTLTDDVVVNKTRDKQILYTDLLHYDSKQRTVNCPGKTKMESDGVTIDGGSFNYNITLEKYVIENGVTCILSGFSKP